MNKPVRVGVVMDPIEKIKIAKDSTFAMMLAAQRRGWQLLYMQQNDLRLRDGRAFARWREITVQDDKDKWFQYGASGDGPIDEKMDVILMRKDPPFDMEYVYSTYMLEMAEQKGVLVVNKPQSLRDANEKLYTAWFPQCCVPTLVSRSREDLRAFVSEQQDVIVKPLGLMGGASIFRVSERDPNLGVILETITHMESEYVMAQRFIPEIVKGDKRILVVDGKPVDYALARIPKSGETRGNLAAGGTGVGVPLSERDYWIVEQVAPTLVEKGLMFVGLDVIGDYLTEINVTSPTCIRELDAQYHLDIAGDLMDAIERRLA
ncbi:MAG: glutathione synthase [Gammaproteobacteria bacterium]|nr:glutathione synthase [Gammaproteobacteria bacterium]